MQLHILVNYDLVSYDLEDCDLMFIGRKKNLQNYMWDHDEDNEVPFIYLGNWWAMIRKRRSKSN